MPSKPSTPRRPCAKPLRVATAIGPACSRAVFAAERATRVAIRQEGATSTDLDRLVWRVLAAVRPRRRDEIRRLWAFARVQAYPGTALSREVYLAHVLRVAHLAAALAPRGADAAVRLALLHNIAEVGGVAASALAARVGTPTQRRLWALRVQRSRQRDHSYLRLYYAGIARAGPAATLVKIADKIDNLYTLCLTADAGRRARYLDEVETHVRPLATRAGGPVGAFVAALAADARRTGHCP